MVVLGFYVGGCFDFGSLYIDGFGGFGVVFKDVSPRLVCV